MELSTKPVLTMDEVQHIQPEQIVLSHMCSVMVDTLAHEKKTSNCHGCPIQHPSQRQHSFVPYDVQFAIVRVNGINAQCGQKQKRSVCSFETIY